MSLDKPYKNALVPTLRQLRRLIDKLMLTDSDLDAFLIDYYKETVFRRTTRGMNRIQKVNVLFELIEAKQIFMDLCNAEPNAQEWDRDTAVATGFYMHQTEKIGGSLDQLAFSALSAFYNSQALEKLNAKKVKFTIILSGSHIENLENRLFIRELVLDIRELASDSLLILESASSKERTVTLLSSKRGYRNIMSAYRQRKVMIAGYYDLIGIGKAITIKTEKEVRKGSPALIVPLYFFILLACSQILSYLIDGIR